MQFFISDARYSEELRNHARSLFTCLQFCKHIKPAKSEPKSGKTEKTSPDDAKGASNPDLSSQASLLSQESIDSISSASERAGLCLAVCILNRISTNYLNKLLILDKKIKTKRKEFSGAI